MKKKNSTISKIKKEVKAEIKTESSKAVDKETPKTDSKKVEKLKYTYRNVSNMTINDSKKIDVLFKKEGVRLAERMGERKINIGHVIKVNKFHQQKFQNGLLKADFVRFWFFLKDGSKSMINFSKSYKADKK